MSPEHFQIRIGLALRKSRESFFADGRPMSQEVFADVVKMHRTYYSAIERGEKNVTIKTLKRVCNALRVTVSDIVEEAERCA